ncbi:unnamed protein product [Citrullus colocynthis]|uniref:Uncharacterized protein n=1 Tax=Citrullus colocynthis TaxID=252529 RepID=A0ABP0Y979_9ROSI
MKVGDDFLFRRICLRRLRYASHKLAAITYFVPGACDDNDFRRKSPFTSARSFFPLFTFTDFRVCDGNFHLTFTDYQSLISSIRRVIHLLVQPTQLPKRLKFALIY